MNKIISTVTTISVLALPLLVLAQREEAPELDIMQTLDAIVNWLFTILLIVAAIFIIIAAYFFVTAAGDPEKTGKARNFVLYALIGVLVGFAAKGLVLLIGQIVGWEVAPF